MTKSIGCVNQRGDENFSLDIFQQTPSTNDPAKELVTKVLLIFRHTKWISKISSVFFNGGESTKPCFL
jgi:hypothetical protein